MCGIAGQWVLAQQRDVDLAALGQRAERIRHRGPEQRGSWTNGRVAIIHHRLILRDPHMGTQPMVGASGCVLAYNGELYNSASLRAELLARGKKLIGSSDTEIVLAAYEEWGEAAWLRFNGMFAFVLFDQRRERLLLVRDALGLKPLYYYSNDGEIAFASEPRALRTVLRPSLDGVLCYLRTARPSDESQTLFENVQAVPPGGQVEVLGQTVTVTRWMQTFSEKAATERPEHEQKAHIRFLLERSVGEQSDSEYPLGLFLSGGVDSAILCAILKNQGRKFTAHTIALAGDTAEFEDAAQIAAARNVPLQAATLSTADYFSALRELVELRGLPLSFSNDVLIFALSQRAAASAKILISGEGADELFGGYSYLIDIAARYHEAVNSPLRTIKIAALKMQLTQASFDSPHALLESITEWWSAADLRPLLSATARDTLDHQLNERRVHNECATSADPALYLMTRHLPNLLNRLDGATMAASVEGRVPFTDDELIRYVMSQRAHGPFESRWRNKQLLKQAFEDCLPLSVRAKPKRPFDASLAILFAGHEGVAALQNLKHADALAPYFDLDQVRTWISQNDASRNLQHVWLLYNLHLWLSFNNNTSSS